MRLPVSATVAPRPIDQRHSLASRARTLFLLLVVRVLAASCDTMSERLTINVKA